MRTHPIPTEGHSLCLGAEWLSYLCVCVGHYDLRSTAGLLTHEESVGSKFRPPPHIYPVIVRRGGMMTAAEQAVSYI